MFIHFSLSSQGVRLFGRVRLFGSLEYKIDAETTCINKSCLFLHENEPKPC